MAITLVDNQLEEVVRILPKGLQAIRDIACRLFFVLTCRLHKVANH